MAVTKPSLLLLFETPPQPGDSFWSLLDHLRRDGVVPSGFSWHPTPAGKGKRLDPAVAWTAEDPSLRWQALRKILDSRSLDAVGFCGSAAFERLAPLVLPHTEAPTFAFFPETDTRPPSASRPRWLRGARKLRLVLADTATQRARLEKLFGRTPFELADLTNGFGWLSRLHPPKPKSSRLTSLITPVFNKIDYTLRCVASVQRNTPERFEWIFIDNASSDATLRKLRELAKKDKRIRILRNDRNLGFAPAVNQGMKKAKGDVLVILNNDVVVAPGWLAGLLSCFEQDTGLGAVGPCTNQAADVHQHRHARYELDHFEAFATAWGIRYSGRVLDMHRLIGFCMALKRDAVEQVGLFDERFHIGGYEDYDYSLRLRQAGWRLALAESVFVHHFGHVSYKSDDAWLNTVKTNREVFLDKWTRKSLEFLDNLSDLRAQSTW